MRRILLTGLGAGLVVFAWSAFSHMVLPLGEMGIAVMPNESAVVESLRANIPTSGLYMIPGMEPAKMASAEERRAWEQRYMAGPRGVLVYQPGGADPMSPRQLGLELASDVLAGLMLAWVLSMLSGPSRRRVAAAAALGLFAWLSISASHWIWYGFPTAFIVAEGVDQVVGWLIAGMVAARFLTVRP